MQDSPASWWRLPPELRSIILTLAYVPDGKLKVKTRPQVETEAGLQRQRRVEAWGDDFEVS